MEGIVCTEGGVVAVAAAPAAFLFFLAAASGSLPCHTPSRTPCSSSVLVSWHSAHGEHHSHTQKSDTAEPLILCRSLICILRHAPSPIAAAPATADTIVSACHAVLYWPAQNSTLRANDSASAAPLVAASALSAAPERDERQRSFET